MLWRCVRDHAIPHCSAGLRHRLPALGEDGNISWPLLCRQLSHSMHGNTAEREVPASKPSRTDVLNLNATGRTGMVSSGSPCQMARGSRCRRAAWSRSYPDRGGSANRPEERDEMMLMRRASICLALL